MPLFRKKDSVCDGNQIQMSVQQRAEVDVSISVLMWWAVTDVHAILATFWNQTIIIANVIVVAY
jgi:hypothetical protein